MDQLDSMLVEKRQREVIEAYEHGRAKALQEARSLVRTARDLGDAERRITTLVALQRVWDPGE